MTIRHPTPEQLPLLRKLWQQAFGDDDRFLDNFFSTAFSVNRCLFIPEADTAAAALYWLDCACRGEKLAYLYAVATDLSHRGKGLCHALMAEAHNLLKSQSYAGIVLVPGSEDLFRFYESMGYRPFGGMAQFQACAEMPPVPLRRISMEEYADLRRKFLPEGGVLQENVTLAFLQTQLNFYAGADCLLIAAEDGDKLICPEILGNRQTCGQILSFLKKNEGQFRAPGEKRFAMYLPLTDVAPPSYFGLALD